MRKIKLNYKPQRNYITRKKKYDHVHNNFQNNRTVRDENTILISA